MAEFKDVQCKSGCCHPDCSNCIRNRNLVDNCTVSERRLKFSDFEDVLGRCYQEGYEFEAIDFFLKQICKENRELQKEVKRQSAIIQTVKKINDDVIHNSVIAKYFQETDRVGRDMDEKFSTPLLTRIFNKFFIDKDNKYDDKE